MKIFKKLWAFIPLFLVVISAIILFILNQTLSLSLRTTPMLIFSAIGTISFCMAFIFLIFRLQFLSHKYLKKVLRILSVILSFAIIITNIFVSILLYKPEYIVTKNNVKMVATVSNWLSSSVNYYKYENKLFYGKFEGFERYKNPVDSLPSSDQKPYLWEFKNVNGKAIDSYLE